MASLGENEGVRRRGPAALESLAFYLMCGVSCQDQNLMGLESAYF